MPHRQHPLYMQPVHEMDPRTRPTEMEDNHLPIEMDGGRGLSELGGGEAPSELAGDHAWRDGQQQVPSQQRHIAHQYGQAQ